MKSILQLVTVLSVAALLASCGGSSDGDPRGSVVITPQPQPDPEPEPDPPQQDGLAGTALKGLISGGAVTVTDGDGNDVAISEGGVTAADGSYDITLAEDVSLDTITLPVVVHISGGNGATSICDIDNEGTDDDCLTNDGVTYVAYGQPFELPADFSMEAVLASLPEDSEGASTTFTANITPATHLQAALARKAVGDGASLTVDAVQNAEELVLGLIASVTGVDMTDVDLATIPVEDVSTIDEDSADSSAQSLALSAFAASVAGLVDATDEDQNNVQEVLVNLVAAVSGTDDGIEISGTDIAELSEAVSESLGDITAAFDEAGVDNDTTAAVAAAQSTADQKAEEGTLIGDNPVTVAPVVVDPTGDSAKTVANRFLDSFINVLNAWTDATGAEQGTTNSSPTEILFTELANAETYGAGAATMAFDHLMDALIAAEASLEPGASVVNDDSDQDNLQFTLAKDESGVVTLTDGWSMTMGKEDTVRTTITIASGTWQRDSVDSEGNGSGEFDLSGVELLTETIGETDSQLQHFSGNVNVIFAPDPTDPGDLGVTTLTYSGTHFGTSSSGDSFTVAATLSGLTGTALEEGGSGGNIDGDYTITFTFSGDQTIALNLNGVLRAAVQNFWMSGGGNTILGTVTEDQTSETTTLTDGSAILTIVIDTTGSVSTLMSAAITVGEEEIATINADGLVTFTDSSIRFLPAGLF